MAAGLDERVEPTMVLFLAYVVRVSAEERERVKS